LFIDSHYIIHNTCDPSHPAKMTFEDLLPDWPCDLERSMLIMNLKWKTNQLSI